MGLNVVVIMKRRRVVVLYGFGVLFEFGYCDGIEDDLVGCRYRESVDEKKVFGRTNLDLVKSEVS